MLCYKIEVAFAVIVTIATGVVFVFVGATEPPQLKNIKEQKALTWTPVPWLGVLTLEGEYTVSTEGLIIVTIISDKVGIADAKCMTALNKYNWEDIRNNTHVMFLTRTNRAWYAKVDKFILHPEFNEETLTTMAILYLEYDVKKFEGNMVRWPSKFRNHTYKDADMFTIGYTDRNRKLEQTVYRMDYIQLSECQKFYFLEALDTKWMRPKHYHCYNVRYNKQSCVFDPAMALVQYAAGKYTLMGLSVWGPGCSLPTRFFDFEPFVPWIMTKLPSRRVNYFKAESVGVFGDTKKSRDRWMLARISDAKLALRPIKSGTSDREIVQGQCDEKSMKNSMLVFRDVQRYTTRCSSDKRDMRGVAVYALSLYDKKFDWRGYTCIQITAKCKKKSKSHLEVFRGYGNEPLDPYIKHGYAHRPSYALYPYVHTLQNNYDIVDERTAHLTFRFEFEREATLEIIFYANRRYARTTPTTTVPPHKRTRKRRPYRTTTLYPYKEYWFYKYGHHPGGSTTESAPYKPKTTTTITIKNKRPTTVTKHWWNKWWHYAAGSYPGLDKDWWKG